MGKITKETIKNKCSAFTEGAAKTVKSNAGSFLILLTMYLVGMISLIRANYKYIDDFGRVFEGYKGWDDFSRFSSVLISPFLHADNYLTDISPATQIIAAIFLSLAGVIAVNALTAGDDKAAASLDDKALNAKDNDTPSQKKQKPGSGIIRSGRLFCLIAALMLGFNPYFLECLSYKYDSPYMALSILAAIAPIAFVDSALWGFALASAAGTILMLTTYQASSGIFPILVCVVIASRWNRGEELKPILKKTLSALIGYAAGMGIYRFFIMKEVDEYVSSSIAPMNEIVSQFVNYYKQVYSDYKIWWLLLIALIMICFLADFIISSKQNKIVSALMACLVIVICLLMAFGMYPALSRASYYPRAMYGFGAMTAILAICAARRLYSGRFFVCALSWTFFIFTVSYGNCLYEQARYTDFRVQSVIDDIKDLDMLLDDEEVIVQISGSIGKSPVIRNIPQSGYTILDRLVPETFAGDWKWSKYYFYNYFDIKNITEDRSIDLNDYDLPMVKDTIYHTVYAGDHKLLIVLKQ